MGPPILKKATDTAPGTSAEYGAPDTKKAFDIMDGTHPTERIQASVIETTGPSDVQTDLNSKADISHTHSFVEITDLNVGISTNASVIAKYCQSNKRPAYRRGYWRPGIDSRQVSNRWKDSKNHACGR